MRWTVAKAVLLLSAIFVATVTVAVARPQTFWSADGGSVAESLTRKSEGFWVMTPCRSTGGRRWTCTVGLNPSDGSGRFVVTMRDGDCWTARGSATSRDRSSVTVRGCLSILDHVWPS